MDIQDLAAFFMDKRVLKVLAPRNSLYFGPLLACRGLDYEAQGTDGGGDTDPAGQ